MEFSFTINETSPTTTELLLSGFLDEFAKLPEDYDYSKVTKLYVDFSKVEFINSGGIKLWVNFIDELERRDDLTIYFRKCRRMVVDQINLIEGFLPKNGHVLSVFVPIFCEKCEKGIEVFQDISKLNEDFDDVMNRAEDPGCGGNPAPAL